MKTTTSMKENNVFRHMYAKGKSEVYPLFILYYKKNNKNINILGITVSKKIGNAVLRNRAKRLIREAYRLSETKMKTGYSFVFVARTRTTFSSMKNVKKQMESALQKNGILL